jgi:hypothetical protein
VAPQVRHRRGSRADRPPCWAVITSRITTTATMMRNAGNPSTFASFPEPYGSINRRRKECHYKCGQGFDLWQIRKGRISQSWNSPRPSNER